MSVAIRTLWVLSALSVKKTVGTVFNSSFTHPKGEMWSRTNCKSSSSLLLQVPGDQVQTKSEADDNLLLFYRNVILSNVVVQSETAN